VVFFLYPTWDGGVEMKTKMSATIVKTESGMTYVIIGVRTDHPTGIDSKIPTMIISIGNKVEIIKNPKKEMISLGPIGCLNDEYRPKSINLVGVHYPLEKFISVEPIECEITEPEYKEL
jgi:hypothetical protein